MVIAVSRLPLRRYETFQGLVDAGSKVLAQERLQTLREAASLIDVATERARNIIADANGAHEAERRKGYAKGLDEARREQATQVIENVARNIDFLEKSEDRIVDLVMQAVRKVIEGFGDRERTVAAVRSVLAIARDQKQVTLRLSPEQADALRAQIQDMMAAYPSIGFIEVVSERQLTGDTCVMESEMGVVEASIEIQLAAIQSAFDRTLGRTV
jgi:type III secretion protein L